MFIFYFLSNIIQFHSVKISKNTHLLFFCFCEFFIHSFHFCIYCTIFHIIFCCFSRCIVLYYRKQIRRCIVWHMQSIRQCLFAKLFLSMRNISTRQKPLEKNLYLSCIFSQADTKSRLNRPSAYESCQVPCHPAYFLHNLCKQTFYGKYIFKQKWFP